MRNAMILGVESFALILAYDLCLLTWYQNTNLLAAIYHYC